MLKQTLSRFIAFTTLCFLMSILTPVHAADSNARDVADKLNKLYQRTEPCENDKSAFYCSGVFLHGREHQDHSSELWYPEARGDFPRAAISYSYLRIDISPHVGKTIFAPIGYILTPLNEVNSNKQYQYHVFCAYAGDGYTFGGVDQSCGFNAKPSDAGHMCRSEGIDTASRFLKAHTAKNEFASKERRDSFIQQYAEETAKKVENTIGINSDACSFLPNKKDFDTAMQVYKYAYRDHPDILGCSLWYVLGKINQCETHNEIIIGAWNTTDVAINKVPILAFFVEINHSQEDPQKSSLGSSDVENIKAAFKAADEYSKATHYARRIPIVTIDMDKLNSGLGDIFAPA